MKYVSTRRCGGNRSASADKILFTFEEALTSGYAPDRGLFVPDELPRMALNPTTLKHYSCLSYPELTFELLKHFISTEEIPLEDLRSICADCFKSGWPDRPSEILPVIRLPTEHTKMDEKSIGAECDDKLSLYVSELFHGPTQCFKDFGLQMVVRLLDYFSHKRKKKMTLLVSTTGDTGPAAATAVSNLSRPCLLSIIVHYPKGQISDFQRKQMTVLLNKKNPNDSTGEQNNVTIVEFEGGGDDMDILIKNILTGNFVSIESGKNDPDLISRLTSGQQCGVNSYNIGRPLMQMVHWVWTYLRIVEKEGIDYGDPDKCIDVVLPTGAMGNMVGGYIAKQMGLPIRYICAGTNVNDITHRTFTSGEFHKAPGEMKKTLSDAINIQLPYNFERLLYYMTGENSNMVRDWMTNVDDTSKLTLDASWLERLQEEFKSARVTDEKMCDTMSRIKKQWEYFVDPHTAVAFSALEQLGYYKIGSISSAQDEKDESDPKIKKPILDIAAVAVLSTASPCKFEESVTAALGREGWEEYTASKQYPKHAKDVAETNDDQAPLVIFEAVSSKNNDNMTEQNRKWQFQLQQLIVS